MLSGITKIYKDIKWDIVSYINEYGFNLIDNKDEVYQEAQSIKNHIYEYIIVLIIKDGCSYCAHSKLLLEREQKRQRKLLLKQQESNEPNGTDETIESNGTTSVGVFTIKTIKGTDSITKTAVGLLLNLSDVTFPQIICNGVYIGGADNLRDWVIDGQFDTLIGNGSSNMSTGASGNSNQATTPTPTAPIPIPWFASLEIQSKQPDLFQMPRMDDSWYPLWPWYLFQWTMYSNIIRYISILQLLIMIPAAILFHRIRDEHTNTDIHTINTNSTLFQAAYWLLIVLLIDLSLLVFHGPTPLSPSGTISTYFGWKIRGNATSAIPYKVVFVIYIVTLLPLLLLEKYDSIYSAMIGFIINSSILVIFRF